MNDGRRSIRTIGPVAATAEVGSSEPDGSETIGLGDETLLEATGLAPSFRAPVKTATLGTLPAPGGRLQPGELIDEFEIVSLLGEGSLAKVYLARQLSLERLVALKVSFSVSDEARTLASLEHDHIVRVFSEVIDPDEGVRLLCMQYVSGISLERLIRELRRQEPGSWSGQTILDVIDSLGQHPGVIDPAAFPGREQLRAFDRIEAVCWIGARLAEALAFAHSRDVLHRDIKPANILINPYGRPLLADFNLASAVRHKNGAYVFGGSLAFMAPEHLEAFDPADPTPSSVVDRRSDLYSLGVVLFELLTGQSPFARVGGVARDSEVIRIMAAERRRGAPSARSIDPHIPPALDRALQRCMDPDPSRRYPTAAELADDLDGSRTLRGIDRRLPTGPLTLAAIRRPRSFLVLGIFLPHLLASAINISYNASQIVGHLTVQQQARFFEMVLAYNAATYPLSVLIVCRIIGPVFRTWTAIERSRPVTDEAVADARRRVLGWSLGAVALAIAGWLPCGFIFPIALVGWPEASEPLAPGVVFHFMASFGISGLIALTYSFFGIESIALRVVYPRLWTDARRLVPSMAAELRPREARLFAFQLLAGLIPLSGAALLIGLGPEAMTRSFRTLVGSLIMLGMAGIGLATTAARMLNRTLAALLGANTLESPRPQ